MIPTPHVAPCTIQIIKFFFTKIFKSATEDPHSPTWHPAPPQDGRNRGREGERVARGGAGIQWQIFT